MVGQQLEHLGRRFPLGGARGGDKGREELEEGYKQLLVARHNRGDEIGGEGVGRKRRGLGSLIDEPTLVEVDENV